MEYDHDNIAFITVNDLSSEFIDIQDDFFTLIYEEIIDLHLEIEILSIFNNSFSISLEGDKDAILDFSGYITKLLISEQLCSFTYLFHIVEKLEEPKF